MPKDFINYTILPGRHMMLLCFLMRIIIQIDVYKRQVTLVVESLLLFVCIQLAAMNENIAKIFVSIVTVIGNYVFCKFMIFKPKTQE